MPQTTKSHSRPGKKKQRADRKARERAKLARQIAKNQPKQKPRGELK